MRSLFFLLVLFCVSTSSVVAQSDSIISYPSPADTAMRRYSWGHIPQPIGQVNDFERIFSDGERQTLDSFITASRGKTSIQVALVTIDSYYTVKDSFHTMAVLIAKAWGVGEKGKNNGVTVVLSQSFRKIRIVNGYGIEKILSDAETKWIIDTYFIPGYRRGEYYQTTLKGLDQLMTTLIEKMKLR